MTAEIQVILTTNIMYVTYISIIVVRFLNKKPSTTHQINAVYVPFEKKTFPNLGHKRKWCLMRKILFEKKNSRSTSTYWYPVIQRFKSYFIFMQSLHKIFANFPPKW